MRILQGKADAGVTWASKVQFQKKLGNPIGGVEIPGAQNITATYAAGVMVNAPHLRAAAQWLRYLNAPELLAIYHEFGFHSIQEHAAQNRGADAVFNAKRAGLELVLLVLGGVIAGCSGPCPTPIAHPSSSLAEYEEAAIPTGSAGEKIRLGKHIFDETPKYASAHVGNQLSCSDCHIQSGRAAYSAPMIDIAGIFPRYNKRAGRVISLQERFQECFTRSENGGPLPEDGKELNALIAYVNWLSRDGVKGKAYPGRGFVNIPALTGNPVKGKAVSTAQCACCHGADGAGVPPVLPPLWGNHSYNEGAGMNNVTKLAAFLVHNMPQNDPGSLSSQDAYDLAAYIHRKPRPKFNQAYKSF